MNAKQTLIVILLYLILIDLLFDFYTIKHFWQFIIDISKLTREFNNKRKYTTCVSRRFKLMNK